MRLLRTLFLSLESIVPLYHTLILHSPVNRSLRSLRFQVFILEILAKEAALGRQELDAKLHIILW